MEVNKPTSYFQLVSFLFRILISFVAYNNGKFKRFSVVSPLQLEFDVVMHYCKIWCLAASLWDLYNMIILNRFLLHSHILMCKCCTQVYWIFFYHFAQVCLNSYFPPLLPLNWFGMQGRLLLICTCEVCYPILVAILKK
jgi:hypothetical protein